VLDILCVVTSSVSYSASSFDLGHIEHIY